MIAFQKLLKWFLYFVEKAFFSRNIQIFVTASLPFHTLQIQKDKWTRNNLDVMN